MTLKTTSKLLAMSATILMLASVVTVGNFMTADASHGKLKTFPNGNVDYFCYGNLSDLNTAKINPCSEFGKAANTWNAIRNVDIDKTRKIGQSEIDVLSATLKDKVVAVMTVDEKTRTHNLEVSITFNTKKQWGDSTDWWHKTHRHDFQTTSLHELGHTLSLDHDKKSKLMKPSLATWDVERSIPSHDKNTVKVKFR